MFPILLFSVCVCTVCVCVCVGSEDVDCALLSKWIGCNPSRHHSGGQQTFASLH